MPRNVQYIINLRDRFTRNLKGANAAVNSLNKSASGLGGTLRSLAPYLGFAALTAGIKSTITVFGKQEAALAQVEQGLKSTNNIAGFTLGQLAKKASDLQKVGIFGDEDILQGVTAQLLTFTNITGKQFEDAQKTILDVTTRLYGTSASAESLRSTSIQLAKALNDPVANLGALSRSGIQFSKQQKEVIKQLYESGKAAEAQNLILTELQKQYGGSNEAAAATATGGLLQLRNSFFDLKEVIGEQFIPIIQQITPSINNAIKYLTENKNVIKDTINIVLKAIKVIVTFKVTMFAMSKAVKIATITHNAFRIAMIAYNRGIRSAIAITKVFNATMKANLIGAVITGIVLLISKLRSMRRSANEAANAQAGLNQQLEKTQFLTNLEAINEFYKKAGISSEGYFSTVEKGEKSWENFINTVKSTDLSVLRNIKTAFEENIEELARKVEKEKEGFRTLNKETGLSNKETLNRLKRQLSIINTELSKAGKSPVARIDTTTKETRITSRSPKIVNINIQKLIETQEINTQTLQQSTAQIKSLITRTIMEALNDTQIAQRAS